ncbi:MAG: stage II sporulation protein D [Psychromonas sp.]|jgi:stage II sporulation protein D
MKGLVLLFFLFFTFPSNSQQLRVGVLRGHTVKRILFSFDNEEYSVYGDSVFIGELSVNQFFDLTYSGEKSILVKKGGSLIGTYSKIFIIQNKLKGSITLNTKIPNLKIRKYEDDFEISASSNGLEIINLVDMSDYLSGVVESEGGGRRELEYYKVQAIMSRSYAIKYQNKHDSEGFDLCDRVHCQAYHSMMRFTPKIDTAVAATKGVIMLDDNQRTVDAYFHANCGGQTCLPEHVWNNSVPYLSSFKDTFCIYTKQATWTKRIDKDSWKNFLIQDYNFPILDSAYNQYLFTFNQEDRLAFYGDPVLGIPLRDIRYKFGLKSTYFSTKLEGNEVVITGRGFGHGVGLCQEGAMKMAFYGYSFDQIVKFYFPGVEFVNIDEDAFFVQKSEELKSFY